MTKIKIWEKNVRSYPEELAGTILSLLNNLPCAIYRGLKDWSITIMSVEVMGITGYTSAEFTSGKVSWKELIHPDDITRVKESFRSAVNEGTGFLRTEYRFRHKDGSYKWFEDRRQMIYDSTGSFAYVDGLILDITEHKHAKDAVIRSEEHYRTLAETAHDYIFIVDRDLVVRYVNTFAAHFLGENPDEIAGKPLSEVFPPDVSGKMQDSLQEVFATGNPVSKVNCFTLPQGDWWLNTQLVPIGRKDGNVREVMGVSRDITQQKKAEEALRKSEERYRNIVETMNEGLAVGDQNYVFTYVNKSFCEILGYSQDEMVGHQLMEFVHEDDRELMKEQMDKRKKGITERFEMAWRAKDGQKILTLASPRAFFDEEGRFKGSIGVLTDITQRKKAEEELQKSEALFRAMAENISEAFWLFDWETQKVVYASPAYEEIWGRPVQALYDRYEEWGESIHPDDRSYAEETFARILETGGGEPREYRIIRPNGEIRWVSDRGFMIPDREGQIKQITGIAKDITARREAENALRKSEEKYRSVVEESLVGVYIFQDGIFQFVNKRLCEFFGYTREEIVGKLGPHDLTHPEDKQVVEENVQRRLNGEVESIEYEFRGLRKNGEVFPVKAFGRMSSYEGRPAIKGTLFDLTKEKELENQYFHSQKMEAVGRLAGGIAHDINNYLGAIMGFAELVKMKHGEDVPLSQKMDDIINSTYSASTLIDQLLAYGKRQFSRPKVVNLNSIIKSMQQMLERLIGEDIDFSLFLAEDLYNVKIDPSQVEQILVNLLINARDAMPKGGKITIETANAKFFDEHVMRHPELKTGRYVKLGVSDTGTGIPDEIREKIFEPFFTTKNKDKSSGLGLATIYGIVEQNGGFIQVKSASGSGATIAIFLPLCDEELTGSLDEKSPETRDLRGSEKILFVEDNDDVRSSTKSLLDEMGYRVIVAANGLEALDLFEDQGDDIDLIITDVVMPEMSGKELMERIHGKKKKVAALFISGYDDDVVSLHGILQEKIHFLQKPFTSRDLAGKIKEILLKSPPLT